MGTVVSGEWMVAASTQSPNASVDNATLPAADVVSVEWRDTALILLALVSLLVAVLCACCSPR